MLIFRRLLGFLRPYRGAVGWSFVLAFGAMGTTVLIPYLTGRAIDAIHPKLSSAHATDRHHLVFWVLAIAAAGLARLVLSAARRLVAGRVSLGVEVDLRKALYSALQPLELAFFDRQQTGQLMSRATVDLQSVRFFLGYGLIFIAQSILTIVLAAVAMFALQPDAGGAVARAGAVRGPDRVDVRPPVAARASGGAAADRRADRGGRGERLRRPRGQGVRPGGAPARALRALGDARVRPADVRDPDPGAVHAADQLPAEPRPGPDPAGRRAGRDPRVADDRGFHRLLRVSADADLADADARVHAERGAARDRVGRADLRDPRPRAADHEPRERAGAARRARTGVAPRRQPDVRRRRPAGAARRRSRDRAWPHGRARRRDGLGQDGARVAAASAVRGQLGIGPDRRRRRPLGRPRTASATRSRSSPTTRSCSRPRSTTTSPTRGPTRRARRSSERPRSRRPTGSSARCPRATTRWSASAG